MPDPVLVAGGTGFVGRRLVAELAARGERVRVMTRHPESYHGPGEASYGDVTHPGSIAEAMRGCASAYYLVHSLDIADFEARDAAAARAFGAAAALGGVGQIVYLGGLGDDADDLSAHLRSRRQVESLLGEAGVPVTTLRAGIVIGHRGISWEITRQLVEHLPAMVTPRWVRTRTQPIGVDDVVRYLLGVLGNPSAIGRTFEIGGPDVLAYAEMLQRVARIEGRRLPIVPVPLLSPALSSRWLALVTDVDVQAGRNLIDSMVNEVVVRDDSIREVVPIRPIDYDTAVRRALAEGRAEGRAAAGSAWWQRIAARLPMPLSHVVFDVADRPGVESRRRRFVVAGTSLVGAGLLGYSLSSPPGSRAFYRRSAATAAVWAVGGLCSGRLHLGWIENRGSALSRPVLVPIGTGVAAFAVFYLGALAVRRSPPLEAAIARVLQFADDGDDTLVLLTTLANGVGEEVFFRGALYAALGDRRPALGSTLCYAVATTTTRNPALVFAASVMGTLFGLQRRATGGLQAPVITHLTWSTLMVRFLPPLFRNSRRKGGVIGSSPAK